MEKGQKKKLLRQWHSAFYAGIRIEFSGEADKLCFENKHQLGTRPKARHLNLIYHIEGELFPVQVICTSELTQDSNMWLRSLTDDLEQGELVEKLLRDYRKHQKNSLYKSVMNMVIQANWEIFEEEKNMCEALRELFGDELTTAVAAGVEAGIKEQLPIAVEERVAEIIDVRMEEALKERVAEAVEARVAEAVEVRVAEVVEVRVAEAVDECMAKVRQEGIRVLIADNLEEGFSMDKILGKLEKRFGLTALEARGYFEQFTVSNVALM